MKNNLIKIPSTGDTISYFELADLDTQKKLKDLNTSNNDNILYCTCNGDTEGNLVKMMTRGINDNSSYIVANYPKTRKHHKNCPRHSFETEIASKGRIYKQKGNYIPLNVITSGPNKQIALNNSIKYTNLFGIGEYILSKAHNDYCNTYSKNAISTLVLSELYEYYHNYCNGNIISPLKHFVINNSEEDIYLNDIIFNPKWISCDEDEDKTSAAIKNFRILNKKINKPKSITKEYLLLKYEGYEDFSDNQVKIKLYTRGKNTKTNFDKYIYAYMNKDTFLDTLEMYSFSVSDRPVDRYISALVYVKNHTLIIDEFTLITTYPNYCIPISSYEDLEILDDLLKLRNKLLIFTIAKLDNSFNKEFNNNIPDYIVRNIETNKTVLIEIFNKYSSSYFNMMLSKTEYYEDLSESSDYGYIGYYKNLGWNSPPMTALLFKKFNTLKDITSKVESSLKKLNYER